MRRSAALAIVILLTPALARAAWLPDGNRIDTGSDFVATASGPGRVVVAWMREVGPGQTEVRAQAWTAEGDLPTGWPSSGVLVSAVPGLNLWPRICEDGAGGVFVAWLNEQGSERSFYVQHVSAAGSRADGWAAEGLLLGTVAVYTSVQMIAHDGVGGVLVGWVEYPNTPSLVARSIVRRIDAGGAPATGWPAEGYTVANAYELGLAADSERHLFVSTAEYDPVERRVRGLRVQRLGDSAAPDPGWPETGALLSYPGYPTQIGLFPDGTGGVFADWGESLVCVGPGFEPCPPVLRSAARVLSDGTQDDRWIPRPRASTNAPDGTGGMLLGNVSSGRPSVLRLDAGGSVMPGWAPGGNPAMTEVVSLWGVLVTTDGSGGAFVAWRDWRTGEDRLYASRLDANGRLAPGWPTTGSFVGTHGNLVQTQLVSLGGGVAVVLWEEWAPEGRSGHLLALRPGEPGPIARLNPVPTPVGFGVMHVRPNPARGQIVAIVELPNEGPARIDLVDAAGRVLESQDFTFQWQARGAVYFNQARSLPAGVYWIRVVQGSRRSSQKLVVLE